MEWYITKLVVDLPWPGGVARFFLASGGGKHFFGVVRGGATFFFLPDVVFISNDYVINATFLKTSVSISVSSSFSKYLFTISTSLLGGLATRHIANFFGWPGFLFLPNGTDL